MGPHPAPPPVRAASHDELDQLHLQVGLAGVRVGARVRYLITGEAAHLAAEVRWSP